MISDRVPLLDRRSMLAATAGAVTATCLPIGAACAALPPDRLAMTTVCLRDRIPYRGAGVTAPASSLRLEDAPRLIRRTFGLRNVEMWSLQFQDDSDAYVAMVRARTERAGCRICNIQLDADYDLSSPDPDVRRRSVAFAMGWIRRAAILGSPSIRINIDSGNLSDPFVPEMLAPIYSGFGDYGRSLGVRILIENHIGHSRAIPNVVRLLALVDHDNVRGLADWGNSDAPDFAHRLADLASLFPSLALVSAKGLHFDATGRHVEYPIAPIVAATEASGYRGLYSIELYTEQDPPDPITGVKAMMSAIGHALQQPHEPRSPGTDHAI